MNVIENIFVSKEKSTVEKITEGIEYVEKVSFSTLEGIMRKEMFVEIKKKISENEKNEEIYSSLVSFLKMILYRRVGVESGDGANSFYHEMRWIGLTEMIENKVKEIVFDEKKKNSEMRECERDMILGYSLLMKDLENEKNEEIYSSLISFLKMILFRGAGVESGYGGNSFFDEMRGSGLKEMIENKVKEIVFDEKKKNSEMSECERDTIFGYSFLMKGYEIEKELLEKLWKCLILIVKEGISKGKKKKEREGLIGLRCVCENSGSFLSSFSLFLFLSSISFCFLL
jgi:hypothetical protein